jgi:hypothetical protein
MKKIVALLMVSMVPVAEVAAQQGGTMLVTDVNSLTSKIIGIGNIVAYLLVALAVIFIIYNVVIYLVRGADPAAKAKAGGNVLWGIVGLFVIVSVWGLVNILTNTFKTTPTNQPIPNLGTIVNTGGLPGNQIPVVQ